MSDAKEATPFVNEHGTTISATFNHDRNIPEVKHSHYKKDVSHLKMIDVYRVAQLFGVTDHCEFHAIKKILCAGKRGNKTQEQDIREAIDSLNRRLQMIAEDANQNDN